MKAKCSEWKEIWQDECLKELYMIASNHFRFLLGQGFHIFGLKYADALTLSASQGTFTE